MTVIDVGCGSGILSVAALKLGAACALGVDIDEAAIRASRENGLTNGIGDDLLELGIGSVKEISEGRFKLSSATLSPGEYSRPGTGAPVWNGACRVDCSRRQDCSVRDTG